MVEQEIKQADLAERCGYARQNLSAKLARGTCSAASASKIAEALGVPVREIIKED